MVLHLVRIYANTTLTLVIILELHITVNRILLIHDYLISIWKLTSYQIRGPNSVHFLFYI
jgi:hypothetical protein